MKVALVGAAGRVASRIREELLSRGHDVTGIGPHPEKMQAQAHFTVKQGDINDVDQMAELLKGQDAVVTAVPFVLTNPRAVVDALKQAKLKRLIVVGGAGSLEVSPGVALLDSDSFPPQALPEATAGHEFLNVLRGERDLDWTYISPSQTFIPGRRTGKYRLGRDALLYAPDGKSWISFEDYAIALVHELEHPEHVRERITVGY